MAQQFKRNEEALVAEFALPLGWSLDWFAAQERVQQVVRRLSTKEDIQYTFEEATTPAALSALPRRLLPFPRDSVNRPARFESSRVRLGGPLTLDGTACPGPWGAAAP